MALDTAKSLDEVCRTETEEEEVQDTIHAKAYEKSAEKQRTLGIETS